MFKKYKKELDLIFYTIFYCFVIPILLLRSCELYVHYQEFFQAIENLENGVNIKDAQAKIDHFKQPSCYLKSMGICTGVIFTIIYFTLLFIEWIQKQSQAPGIHMIFGTIKDVAKLYPEIQDVLKRRFEITLRKKHRKNLYEIFSNRKFISLEVYKILLSGNLSKAIFVKDAFMNFDIETTRQVRTIRKKFLRQNYHWEDPKSYENISIKIISELNARYQALREEDKEKKRQELYKKDSSQNEQRIYKEEESPRAFEKVEANEVLKITPFSIEFEKIQKFITILPVESIHTNWAKERFKNLSSQNDVSKWDVKTLLTQLEILASVTNDLLNMLDILYEEECLNIKEYQRELDFIEQLIEHTKDSTLTKKKNPFNEIKRFIAQKSHKFRTLMISNLKQS